jgi:Magnesium chelatase, subunit ChlI C-terminal
MAGRPRASVPATDHGQSRLVTFTHAMTQRRAVPRRATGVRSRGPGGHPPAARGRPSRDRARERRGGDAGTLPACRRDEPLPVRLGRRPVRALHLPTRSPGPVRCPDLRAVPRPPGPVGGDAAGDAGRAAGASRRRGIGAGRRPGRCRPGGSGRVARPPGKPDACTERAAIRLADAAGLTARATERLLRVARTIADLDGAQRVGVRHLEEAARYRVPATAAAAARAG